MSHYKIEGRGKVKPESVAIGRGTAHYTPECIPQDQVEVIIKDDQVEELINKLIEKLGSDALGGTDVQTAVDLASKVRGESAIQ